MNDGNQERIFESLLEEMLTDQHPPDLTEQIQARLRQELGPERFQQLRSGRLGTNRNNNSGNRAAAKTRVPVIAAWTSLGVAALTLAAGLVFALAVWKYWPSEPSVKNNLQAQVQPTPTTEDPAKPDSVAPLIVAAPKQTELPLPPFKQVLNDPLPIGPDAPLPEIASRPPAAAPVAALDERSIVRAIDERFTKLWESQGISVTAPLDKEQWIAQVALRLTGATHSSASFGSPQELSQKIVSTATFAESFADRIASYWLKGTAEADPKHPAGQQLRSYLAQQIVAKKPWNEVLSSLINSSPDQPQAVWLASLAGGGNHRLAARIGSLMLDEALACARCHDASDNGRVVSMDQDDYWSLVALFYGIDGKASQPKEASPMIRQLVDNQQHLFEGNKLPSVYFDRPDGRVQAARYRLPGGDDWRTTDSAHTPRESLAHWIDRSSITDQASVNLAWRLVFGRPLVAQHAALDGEGYTQRREILSMLAEQFQAHDRDMGKLVTWLVSSRPFARDTLAIDFSRWVAASEDEIVLWRNATANFAVRLPDESSNTSVRNLESALVRIDKWSGSPDHRRATLAQPTTNPSPKPQTVTKAQDSEPLTGYLIHSVKPNHAQNVFINRLVKSKLNWHQQVDHIAGLIGEPAGNARLHSQAQKILDAKDGDRAAALFQLLQGVLLCHEAL